MGLKKKIMITIAVMLLVLFLLPFVLIHLSQPPAGMGLMMILFFAVNPVTAAVISSTIGKDITRLWWTPLLFSLVFLFSYWFVLEEIVWDILVYAMIYWIIGSFFMIVSFFVVKNK